MLQVFYFCKFFERPSRDQPRKPRGERGGERGLSAPSTFRLYFAGKLPRARCRFLLKDRPSEEHSSRIPRGKEKVSFLRAGSLAPLQLAAKDERAELHLGRSPRRKEVTYRCQSGRQGSPHSCRCRASQSDGLEFLLSK